MNCLTFFKFTSGVLVVSALIQPSLLLAADIAWTSWNISSSNPPVGTIVLNQQSIGVVFNGSPGSPSPGSFILGGFAPTNSFVGGSISNLPPNSNSIKLFGGTQQKQTINFSQAVVDPVIAIWSLGTPSSAAQFVFDQSAFSIEACGSNITFGGACISKSGNTVSGREGNGVIQFDGTYSSLSWINPISENYYAFTVGATSIPPQPPTPVSVPEPSNILGLGLVGLGLTAIKMKGVLSKKTKTPTDNPEELDS